MRTPWFWPNLGFPATCSQNSGIQSRLTKGHFCKHVPYRKNQLGWECWCLATRSPRMMRYGTHSIMGCRSAAHSCWWTLVNQTLPPNWVGIITKWMKKHETTLHEKPWTPSAWIRSTFDFQCLCFSLAFAVEILPPKATLPWIICDKLAWKHIAKPTLRWPFTT